MFFILINIIRLIYYKFISIKKINNYSHENTTKAIKGHNIKAIITATIGWMIPCKKTFNTSASNRTK